MAIITLSRAPFSGGQELAYCLVRHSGYRVVSREELIEKVSEFGISPSRLTQARSKHLGWLPRMDGEWQRYVVYARAALSQEIQNGNLIYLGNNGSQLLRDFPNLLNVGVTGDTSHRIDNLIRRNEYSIDRRAAKRLIARVDQSMATWGKTIYKDGTLDPSEFDIVVDPGKTTVEETCDYVLSAANKPGFQTTSNALEMIDLMSVAAQLRAKIAMDPDIPEGNLEVEILDGTIIISGSVISTEEVESIKELLHEQSVVKNWHLV